MLRATPSCFAAVLTLPSTSSSTRRTVDRSTPATILLWAELVGALLPKGVLNIVNGFGVEAGKQLAQNRRVAKVAFTDGTTTGRLIMQYASENKPMGFF